MGTLNRSLAQVLRGLIWIYQYFLSSFVGCSCRFQPSCSHYALAALQTYSLWKGSFLAFRRILRCHPWHPGGLDPLPLKK